MSVGPAQKPQLPPENGGAVLVLAERRAQRDDPAPKPTGGGGSPPDGPSAGERKFAAKRRNEQVKLFASGMNTLAAAAITTSTLIPAIKGLEAFVSEFQGAWYLVGIGLHIAGQMALRFSMRSEE